MCGHFLSHCLFDVVHMLLGVDISDNIAFKGEEVHNGLKAGYGPFCLLDLIGCVIGCTGGGAAIDFGRRP